MRPREPEPDFDPFDPRFFENPYPAYRALRERAPVHRRPTREARVWPHYWILSRARDVDAALHDWRTFSSARGTLIDTDISLIPPNMFNMDPPRHDELRGILARALTPTRVAALEPGVRASARALVLELSDRPRFDAATEYAQRLPTLTLCELMDLPTADREQFLRWNLDTLAGADFTSDAALRAYDEMGRYWEGLVAERRQAPGPDLISRILHDQTPGQELSDAEIVGFCSLLHDASQNTTMNMIANAIIELSRHPDERRKLVRQPARWPGALEEILRFVSPVQGLARTTTRDVEVAGVTIPAGDQVLLLYGSANHDETVFDRPDELDLDRDVGRHWTFGHGIHFCLGNAVARLETRIALEELLARIPDYAVDESGIVRNQLVPTRGVACAPLEHRADRDAAPAPRGEPEDCPTRALPPVDEEYAFDPTDASKTKDFRWLARIRRERPVCRPAPGIVLTTRYEETARAFRQSKTLSSVGDMRAPGVVVPVEERFLGELDAPLHPKIRRVLLGGFTRRGAATAEPWTRAAVRRRLEALAARGGGDLMSDLSIPLPGSVSAHVLGIPEALHDPVMEWCNELLHSPWPATGRTERGEGIAGAFPELAACIDGLIQERIEAGSGAPRDLLKTMVEARDEDGWQIGSHHVRTLVVNILAGSLSASYLLGNLLYRLLSDASFDARLRRESERIPAAVEESLRLEAPVTFLFRTAREDLELGGCPIQRGEHVMLGIAAANRDEEVHPDPDEFRLDRDRGADHLAFGSGPHVCLGNHLTRMIGRVVIEETLGAFEPGELALARDFEWRCIDHLQEYGPERLPVEIRAGGR